MGVDNRLDLRGLIINFSNTNNVQLRENVSEVALRLITLLGGDISDVTPPVPPTNLVAIAGVLSVSLSWTASVSLDAVRYRVQRSTTSGSGFTTLGETTDTTFISGALTGGTTYYYQVAAIDDAGNVSDYTAEVSATPSASGGSGVPPTPPYNVTADPGDARVTLTWVQSDPTAVSTEVLRGTSSGGSYTSLVIGLTGTSYIDTTPSNGTEYFYVLRSRNANGDVSGYSLEVSATPVAAVNDTPAAPLAFSHEEAGSEPEERKVTVYWDHQVEPDIAYYKVYIGTTTETYTSSVLVPVVNTFDPPIKHTIFSLAAETTYYVVVTAIDTAGQESDPSNEVEYLTAADTVVVVPPAAPTGFAVVSESETSISFQWTANTEPNFSGYRLYGSLVPPTTTPGGSWILLRVIDGSLTSVDVGGLQPDTTYWFYLTATNTSSLESVPSTVISGTTDAGGIVAPPPGGGTGTGGVISGDSGLGDAHKAPGATFDYVLDVSAASSYGEIPSGGLFGLISSQLLNLTTAVTSSGGTMQNKRLAVLLPEMVYNLDSARLAHNVNGRREGVKLGTGSGQYNMEFVKLPNVDGFQIHFIAPWPTSDLSDSLLTARGATKKFRILTTDTSGVVPNTSTFLFEAPVLRENVRVGFWFMEMEASGAGVYKTYKADSNPVQSFLTVYCCDWYARLNRQVGYAGTLKWFCTTYHTNIDQVHYCNMDGPHMGEHFFYEHAYGVGDGYVTNNIFLRTGGQVWQMVKRRDEGVDIARSADGTYSLFAGTKYFRNNYMNGYGRNEVRAASAITAYGSGRTIDMDGDVIFNVNPGTVAVWPPADVYNIQSSEYGTGRNADLITVSSDGGGGQGVYYLLDGTPNRDLIMRNVRFFNKKGSTGAVRISGCRNVDIQDCVFLTDTATGSGVGVMLANSKSAAVPPTGFYARVVDVDNNNQSADITDFTTSYSSIIDVAYETGDVIQRYPPKREVHLQTNHGLFSGTYKILDIP